MLKFNCRKKFNRVHIDGQKNCKDDLIVLDKFFYLSIEGLSINITIQYFIVLYLCSLRIFALT